VLSEIGYPGFVVYLAILLLALVASQTTAKMARQGKAPPDLYHHAVAIQAALVVFTVGGSFLPFQYTEMLWHCIGLAMALRAIAKVPAPALAIAEPATAQLTTTFRPAQAMRGTLASAVAIRAALRGTVDQA
jgi:hypothetical protein